MLHEFTGGCQQARAASASSQIKKHQTTAPHLVFNESVEPVNSLVAPRWDGGYGDSHGHTDARTDVRTDIRTDVHVLSAELQHSQQGRGVVCTRSHKPNTIPISNTVALNQHSLSASPYRNGAFVPSSPPKRLQFHTRQGSDMFSKQGSNISPPRPHQYEIPHTRLFSAQDGCNRGASGGTSSERLSSDRATTAPDTVPEVPIYDAQLAFLVRQQLSNLIAQENGVSVYNAETSSHADPYLHSLGGAQGTFVRESEQSGRHVNGVHVSLETTNFDTTDADGTYVRRDQLVSN